MEGTLYLNGMKLCDVTNVAELAILVEEVESEPVERFIGDEFSFTCEFTPSRNGWLSFLYGRKVTNNWLKCHGGVMSRKGRGRRKET